jgi:hypothetical protein
VKKVPEPWIVVNSIKRHFKKMSFLMFFIYRLKSYQEMYLKIWRLLQTFPQSSLMYMSYIPLTYSGKH